MIRATIAVVFLGIIGSLLYMNIAFPDVKGRIIFSVFALLVTVVKIWESFFTSKEKDARKYHGDWSLVLTAILYLIAGLLMVWEFFGIDRGLNLYVSIPGAVIFLLAAVLRRWSIRTLGSQWAIHVTGESKLTNELELITSGPYNYIRHPIYASYILDLLGLVLAVNAFYSLVFVLVINVPSYMARALSEEKSATRRFGAQYEDYKKKTTFMVPSFW